MFQFENCFCYADQRDIKRGGNYETNTFNSDNSGIGRYEFAYVFVRGQNY